MGVIEPGTALFVVQQECSDYYCGCGGGHITGIYRDRDYAALMADVPNASSSVTEIPLSQHRWTENLASIYDKHGWT